MTILSGKRSRPVAKSMLSRGIRLGFLAWILVAAVCSPGCSVFNPPELPSLAGGDLLSPGFLKPKEGDPYRMADGSAPTSLAVDGSMSMETYQRIRQAKRQNAIVLQVTGDEAPIRVLPLPDGQKSVFVSELLSQTGVLNKFGTVNAVVFRASPDSISGIKMDVKLNSEGNIDPATDYALRAGDRIQVSKRVTTGLTSLVDMALRR